jgi:glycosyltransferase involved in cell wall biosynthesis
MVGHVVKKANLVISWDDHLTKALPKRKCTTILTIPRGIRLDVFLREDGPIGEREATIVCTRALKKWYRVDLLLDAFARVAETNQEARLVIIGEGPEKENLKELSERLEMAGRVSFVGRLTAAGVADVLKSSRVYVAQIAFDGVSASLLEAMASGAFPVVPDNEANRRWIRDGENGLLFERDDSEELAKCLARGLEDEELAKKAARINKEIVRERADQSVNMKVIESRLRDLVKGETPSKG